MVAGMTTADIRAAMLRMSPDEMEFFRELSQDGEPREAHVFLELFHHFPGIHMEEHEFAPAPALVRALPPEPGPAASLF
jgi:hypothetical protein